MTVHDVTLLIFTLIGVVAYVAAAVLGVLGWLVNRPDSSARFMLRVWAFVAIGAGFECIDIAADEHWNWLHWFWYLSVFLVVWNGVRSNWKKAESCRQVERAVAGHRPNWTIK